MTLFLCGISALSILSFNLIYKQNTAYANQTEINNEINPNSNENSQVKPKVITDEELKNNLKKVKISDVKDEMEFYQDRKFDELTQEEVDYAMDFLLTGKCKRVLIGSDVSYSINTDSLYKGDTN
ncbi:hypothetical protein [Faecalimicrobium dakarense]|uniref:hypothetical protein n=1 Tax=Faecalimicrobium dakarense TaxID=1301100 RepID=UPI0004B429BB|nr:hypothetical protein [[Clostridium] dakarense]